MLLEHSYTLRPIQTQQEYGQLHLCSQTPPPDIPDNFSLESQIWVKEREREWSNLCGIYLCPAVHWLGIWTRNNIAQGGILNAHSTDVLLKTYRKKLLEENMFKAEIISLRKLGVILEEQLPSKKWKQFLLKAKHWGGKAESNVRSSAAWIANSPN